MTRTDDYPEADALVLTMCRLICGAPVSETCSGVVSPLVLQASQRVVPPSVGPMVLEREDAVSAEYVGPEAPKPVAPLSHDPEYLEVIANLRRALAGPMRDELSSAVRTIIDEGDP